MIDFAEAATYLYACVLCILVQTHLILIEGLLSGSVVEASVWGVAWDKRLLDLLIFLLEGVVKLLQPSQPFKHVHVLCRCILGLVEAAEILLRVAEVL